MGLCENRHLLLWGVAELEAIYWNLGSHFAVD